MQSAASDSFEPIETNAASRFHVRSIFCCGCFAGCFRLLGNTEIVSEVRSTQHHAASGSDALMGGRHSILIRTNVARSATAPVRTAPTSAENAIHAAPAKSCSVQNAPPASNRTRKCRSFCCMRARATRIIAIRLSAETGPCQNQRPSNVPRAISAYPSRPIAAFREERSAAPVWTAPRMLATAATVIPRKA